MPMNTAKLLLLNVLGGGSAADTAASFTATTTGAQTLTIDELTVSAATTVDWGDGSSNVYTGSGARTHNYAGAGTWTVRILQPLNVTALSLRDAKAFAQSEALLRPMMNLTSLVLQACKVVLDSSDISPLTYFECRELAVGSSVVLNSADMPNWNPSVFWVATLPSLTGVFNSTDVAAWNPANFYLFDLPAGFSGTWDFADVSGWTNNERLNMSTSNLAVTASAGDLALWVKNNHFVIGQNAMSQASVDGVLLGLYTAAQSRTVTGGSMDLSGTNAAPSGVYAAECPPTTGKAAAYELLTDSCGVIDPSETWTSITVTGGLP